MSLRSETTAQALTVSRLEQRGFILPFASNIGNDCDLLGYVKLDSEGMNKTVNLEGGYGLFFGSPLVILFGKRTPWFLG